MADFLSAYRAGPSATLGYLARLGQLDPYGSFLYETLEPLFKKVCSTCSTRSAGGNLSLCEWWLQILARCGEGSFMWECLCCNENTIKLCLWPPKTGGVLRQSLDLLHLYTVGSNNFEGRKSDGCEKVKRWESHLQLRCEIRHGCGTASEKQRNPLPWKQNRQVSWGTLPENLVPTEENFWISLTWKCAEQGLLVETDLTRQGFRTRVWLSPTTEKPLPLLWKIIICRRRIWKLRDAGDWSEWWIIKANVVRELTYSRLVLQFTTLGRVCWD